jgi:Domain of unknown function (DUF4397)
MRRASTLLFCALALSGCGGSSSSSTMPAQAAPAHVRFVDGAPLLETLINGIPQSLGANVYLQVDSKTVASHFSYSSMSSFMPTAPGTHSLVARNTLGYAVGPLKTAALAPGVHYTLVVVGSYPNYSVLTFEEPASGSGAQLSLYEASPAVPQADFGSFRASSKSDFKQRGSANLGSVAAVSLGKSVTNFGGYVGSISAPLGAFTPSQIDSFDSKNVLPFHAAARLSLFLFDPGSASDPPGPVFASLDK